MKNLRRIVFAGVSQTMRRQCRKKSAALPNSTSGKKEGLVSADHVFDDRPIEKPEQDRFGFDTFSAALAKSIAKTGTCTALSSRASVVIVR